MSLLNICWNSMTLHYVCRPLNSCQLLLYIYVFVCSQCTPHIHRMSRVSGLQKDSIYVSVMSPIDTHIYFHKSKITNNKPRSKKKKTTS